MRSTESTDSLFTRLLQLLSLAKQQWIALATGSLMLFVGIGMTLLYPQLFRVIIDEALVNKETIALNQSTLLLVGSFVVYAISGGLRYWLFTISGEKIVAKLRSDLFSHLLHQDISFFDRQQIGKLLSRLSADTEAIQHTLSHELGLLMRYFFTVLGGIALLLFTSVQLTILLLIVVPPTAWLTGVSGNFIRKFSADTQSALATASGLAEESLSSARIIRSYVRESYESANYARAVSEGLAYIKKRVALVALLEGVVNLVASLAVVAVLWYGSSMVINSDISVGTLTSFLIYTFLVTSSLTGLASIWADFTRAAGAADRVFKIMKQKPKMPMLGGDKKQAIEGGIEFQDVCFRYPSRPSVKVIEKLTISVKPGECVAIVGQSGGGKSTIASLICRFYDADEGCVSVDGRDIRQYDPSWLREQVALVEQEPIIFSTSIFNNIRFGNLNASIDDIRRAARLANADDFIQQLPDGYETFVGAKGVQLSGGQKQRIAIARAILKNPKILVLDEVTSSLDSENEQLIMQAISDIKEDRTTLIIAHRLSTVKIADRVLVVNQGSCIESTTEEFINANGETAKLIPTPGY